MKRAALIRVFRVAVRTVLVFLTLFWFGFAIMSGAEDGLSGILTNLPNALPWLGLFAIVYIAFCWELLGGALIFCAGVASIVFFNAGTAPVVLVGISLPLLAVGAVLIICHYLARSDQEI